MHVYILMGFTFAVTAALIAYSKGRNSLGWFIAGFVIGPFALIVAALPRVTREGLYVRCPSCAEVIRADATLCRYCKAQLEPEKDGNGVSVRYASE